MNVGIRSRIHVRIHIPRVCGGFMGKPLLLLLDPFAFFLNGLSLLLNLGQSNSVLIYFLF
jgi:hypothetical protein